MSSHPEDPLATAPLPEGSGSSDELRIPIDTDSSDTPTHTHQPTERPVGNATASGAEPISVGQSLPKTSAAEPMRTESADDDGRNLPATRLNELNRRIEDMNRSFDDMRRSLLSALPGRLNSVFHDVNRGLDRLLETGIPTAINRGRDLFNSVVQQPSLDVYETDDSFIVEVELPGLDPQAITVTSTDNVLTIRGERKQTDPVEDDGYHRREMAYGTFQRTVALPAYVVADEASAAFRNGVLKVRFPKTETGRRRREIPVQAS